MAKIDRKKYFSPFFFLCVQTKSREGLISAGIGFKKTHIENLRSEKNVV